MSWKMCKCTSFCCAVFSNKKSSFSFLFICPPGLPSPPLWTICGAGSYMLRWRPPGSLWPFVTCLRGFLQLVKTFRSASLYLTVLNSVSSAAQINDLTSPQNVSQCKKTPQVIFQAPFFSHPIFLVMMAGLAVRISWISPKPIQFHLVWFLMGF